jgi:hypothetical protein
MGRDALHDVGTTDKSHDTSIHHQFVTTHQGTRLFPFNLMAASHFSSLTRSFSLSRRKAVLNSVGSILMECDHDEFDFLEGLRGSICCVPFCTYHSAILAEPVISSQLCLEGAKCSHGVMTCDSHDFGAELDPFTIIATFICVSSYFLQARCFSRFRVLPRAWTRQTQVELLACSFQRLPLLFFYEQLPFDFSVFVSPSIQCG